MLLGRFTGRIDPASQVMTVTDHFVLYTFRATLLPRSGTPVVRGGTRLDFDEEAVRRELLDLCLRNQSLKPTDLLTDQLDRQLAQLSSGRSLGFGQDRRQPAADPTAAVVMMSGHGTASTAVKAIKMGAYDYLEKPLSYKRVLEAAAGALDYKRSLRPAAKAPGRSRGRSPSSSLLPTTSSTMPSASPLVSASTLVHVPANTVHGFSFGPGGAWRRLYSERRTSPATRRTVASSKPIATISWIDRLRST